MIQLYEALDRVDFRLDRVIHVPDLLERGGRVLCA